MDEKNVSRSPAPPFMTSTLQQEAFNRLDFSPSSTMQAAQQLYEGADSTGGEFPCECFKLCLMIHALSHCNTCVAKVCHPSRVWCARQRV